MLRLTRLALFYYEVVEGTRGRQLDITVAWDTWSSWHYTALFSHYNPSESYAGFIGVCDAEGECIAAGVSDVAALLRHPNAKSPFLQLSY